VEDGPRVGATVVRKDAGHIFFSGEDEFHFLIKQIAQQQNAARDLP
jgi:hypothetical protein